MNDIGTTFIRISEKNSVGKINASPEISNDIVRDSSERNQGEAEATDTKVISNTIYTSYCQSNLIIDTSENQNHNKRSDDEIKVLSLSIPADLDNSSSNDFIIISDGSGDAEITNKSKAGMIAGIVIGVIAIIVILVLLVYILLIKKKQDSFSSDIDLNDDFETNDSVEENTIDNPFIEDIEIDNQDEEVSSQDYTYEEVGFFIPEA